MTISVAFADDVTNSLACQSSTFGPTMAIRAQLRCKLVQTLTFRCEDSLIVHHTLPEREAGSEKRMREPRSHVEPFPLPKHLPRA
jgi:hypothetical protein